MAEECMVCHEPTGKAGRDEDGLYTPNGVGPFCEQCWDDAWPVMVPAAPDPALLALAVAEIRDLLETERFQAERVFRAHGVRATEQALGPWWNSQTALDRAIAALLAPDGADGAGEVAP